MFKNHIDAWKRAGWIFLATIIAIASLALLFQNQIKGYLINRMAAQAAAEPVITATKIDNHKSKKPTITVDGKDPIRAVNATDVAKAALSKFDEKPVAQLSIPKIHLNTAVYGHTSNETLLHGAAVYKENSQPGEPNSNYALVGHHISDSKLLFVPLMNASIGDDIYVKTAGSTYHYRVSQIKSVDKSQSWVVNDQKGHSLITLVTCESATPGETQRHVVIGELVK